MEGEEMNGLEELKRQMMEKRPADWDALPDLSLYMDQVISYLPRQLMQQQADRLTPAMVNNYIKDGLLPRADGKRYSRTHLAFLTMICVLKQVLPVKEIGTLMKCEMAAGAPEESYAHFCSQLDEILTHTADSLGQDPDRRDMGRLALVLAMRSYADKLACQRILAILAGQAENGSQKKSGGVRHA